MKIVGEGDRLIITRGRKKTEVRIEQLTPHFATAFVDGRRINFAWNRSENSYTLLIDGVDYEVEIQDPRAAMAGAASSKGGKAEKDAHVRAPIPGLISRIMVKPGERVKKGTPVVCLDAMKLENEIPSSRNGVVLSVDVEPGQAVEKGQTLFVVG